MMPNTVHSGPFIMSVYLSSSCSTKLKAGLPPDSLTELMRSLGAALTVNLGNELCLVERQPNIDEGLHLIWTDLTEKQGEAISPENTACRLVRRILAAVAKPYDDVCQRRTACAITDVENRTELIATAIVNRQLPVLLPHKSSHVITMEAHATLVHAKEWSAVAEWADTMPSSCAEFIAVTPQRAKKPYTPAELVLLPPKHIAHSNRSACIDHVTTSSVTWGYTEMEQRLQEFLRSSGVSRHLSA